MNLSVKRPRYLLFSLDIVPEVISHASDNHSRLLLLTASRLPTGNHGERCRFSSRRIGQPRTWRYRDHSKRPDRTKPGDATDGQGNYEFRFLPVGEYSMSIEKPGFQKAEVAPFQLSVDQVAMIDVKLVVGQTTESVQVAASAILLQTESGAVGTVIDSQKVVELPLNGRSFVQLSCCSWTG